MKNINGKKGWPTIKDTSCLTYSFNELISIRLKRKTDLHAICREYRDNIRQLADLELIDRCYVSRLHETHINHHLWLNEIHNINRLRNQNKQERLSCICRITGLKQMIQRQSSLIHDLHNIIKLPAGFILVCFEICLAKFLVVLDKSVVATDDLCSEISDLRNLLGLVCHYSAACSNFLGDIIP